MSESGTDEAEKEIDASLQLCKFSMRQLGISFEPSTTVRQKFYQKIMLTLSVMTICYHVFGDIVFIGVELSSSPKIEDIVPYLHTFGYGVLSIAKIFVLWYKKDVFAQLIQELICIWPVSPLDEEPQKIKDKSLAALRITSIWYFAINFGGVLIYDSTPIVIYLYENLWRGNDDAQIEFIWATWYPFNKQLTNAHIIIYLYEMYVGQTCVWITISTDLLFWAMASHISLLLRLLKRKVEAVATAETLIPADNYHEIVENIKLHQRLIRYCNDLEDAFAVSILVNYILSSFNICCVVFVVMVLEPFLAISNKLFIASALIQIGMICWYGDDILHANADIADAAYKSGWYRTDPKCRRALMFLIQRAQKPIAFTAMKFTDISLVTYTSILTRSYSYFALLYNIYKK